MCVCNSEREREEREGCVRERETDLNEIQQISSVGIKIVA